MIQEIHIQDKLVNLAAQTEILWSTLEAIHDAMEGKLWANIAHERVLVFARSRSRGGFWANIVEKKGILFAQGKSISWFHLQNPWIFANRGKQIASDPVFVRPQRGEEKLSGEQLREAGWDVCPLVALCFPGVCPLVPCGLSTDYQRNSASFLMF